MGMIAFGYLSISIVIHPGTTIEDAARWTHKLHINSGQCPISLEFNGCTLIMSAGRTVKDLITDYNHFLYQQS